MVHSSGSRRPSAFDLFPCIGIILARFARKMKTQQGGD